MSNIDSKTVASFGDEWTLFDQSEISEEEAKKTFHEYFSVFPWNDLSDDSEGFDMGCGSGRWARFVAPRVGKLHCIEPSLALFVAKKALDNFENVIFHQTSVESSGLLPGTQDFGYSLGVLHHVPDTSAAIRSCADLLKPGAPLLLYLYYAFDNRSLWFKLIWQVSDLFRRIIHRLPPTLKHLATNLIATLIYWPLARTSKILERIGIPVHGIPLSYYRNHTFYTMRTDSRDRFGTPLEQRFSRSQIESMMSNAGLFKIHFSESAPYWCVVGYKCQVDGQCVD
jgi:SAM-dependent methyltransferase